MKSRFTSALAVVATLLAGAAGAASWDTRETIKLDRAAVVAGSVLPAGTYRIDLAADIVQDVQPVGGDFAQLVTDGPTLSVQGLQSRPSSCLFEFFPDTASRAFWISCRSSGNALS